MAGAEGSGGAEVRRLPIDLEDLMLAMESQSSEMDWYLDTQSGKLVMATDDDRSMLSVPARNSTAEATHPPPN